MSGGEVLDWSTHPRVIVHKNKAAIVAIMRKLGRPIFAAELYVIWRGSVHQSVLDYHLCTLVRIGVVELVFGRPELQFQISKMSQGPVS
jgi:hypothetical protein